MKAYRRHNVSMLVGPGGERAAGKGGEAGEANRQGGGGGGGGGATASRMLRDRDFPQLISVALLAFVLLGLMRATPTLAALRMALLAITAGLAIKLCARLQTSRDIELAKIAQEAMALLDDDAQPVTHWKPHLKLRYALDHASYPPGKWALSHHAWNLWLRST